MPPQRFQNPETIRQMDAVLMVLRNAVDRIESWKPYSQNVVTDCLDLVVPEIDIAEAQIAAIIKRETKRGPLPNA